MGVDASMRADTDYRLRRDGRGGGAREETTAHLLDDGRNRDAALRSPPTDWTLEAKTDRVMGGSRKPLSGRRRHKDFGPISAKWRKN